MQNSKGKLDLFKQRTKSASEQDNNKSLDCGTKQNKTMAVENKRKKPDLTKSEEHELVARREGR